MQARWLHKYPHVNTFDEDTQTSAVYTCVEHDDDESSIIAIRVETEGSLNFYMDSTLLKAWDAQGFDQQPESRVVGVLG